MKSYDLLQFASDLDVADAAADLWHRRISEAQAVSSLHCVALSGGRIAKHLFADMVDRVKRASTPISHVHFFWADERCVPPDHPDSNFITANEVLFQPLSVAPGNIHRLQGELPAEQAVSNAIADIKRYAGTSSGRSVLDLIILGMGEDGHVASLFPNASPEVIHCQAEVLSIDNSPKPPPQRITLSYRAIADATEVWILACGKGKEAALKESLSAGTTPLGRVLNSRSNTKIFTDVAV